MSTNYTVAPWRSAIAHALHHHRNLAHARFLQLATVGINGRPTNRTVVFRGFLTDTNDLKFVTDRRSEKVVHILQNPWAEICWYFPQTREQFRIAGDLLCIAEDDPDHLQLHRTAAWRELSDAAQLQFLWPSPAKPRIKDKEAFSPAQPDPNCPQPDFCLLILNPEQVDYLELRGEPQNRTMYWRDENHNWSVEEVNP